MRRANLIAFDDYVSDATPQYSTTELNNTLGEFDSWTLQAVVDDPKNADSITVQLETSADGRNWSPKNDQPEVSGTLGAGTTTVLQGTDPGTIGAGMALVRLKVTLVGSLSAPSAHVRYGSAAGTEPGTSFHGIFPAACFGFARISASSRRERTSRAGPTSPALETRLARARRARPTTRVAGSSASQG